MNMIPPALRYLSSLFTYEEQPRKPRKRRRKKQIKTPMIFNKKEEVNNP